MVLCDRRKLCYCAAVLVLAAVCYWLCDLRRGWYKLVLHLFYFTCDMLKLLMKLVELY